MVIVRICMCAQDYRADIASVILVFIYAIAQNSTATCEVAKVVMILFIARCIEAERSICMANIAVVIEIVIIAFAKNSTATKIALVIAILALLVVKRSRVEALTYGATADFACVVIIGLYIVALIHYRAATPIANVVAIFIGTGLIEAIAAKTTKSTVRTVVITDMIVKAGNFILFIYMRTKLQVTTVLAEVVEVSILMYAQELFANIATVILTGNKCVEVNAPDVIIYAIAESLTTTIVTNVVLIIAVYAVLKANLLAATVVALVILQAGNRINCINVITDYFLTTVVAKVILITGYGIFDVFVQAKRAKHAINTIFIAKVIPVRV